MNEEIKVDGRKGPRSQATKDLIANKAKESWANKWSRINRMNSLKGRIHTQAHKDKISKTMKAIWADPEKSKHMGNPIKLDKLTKSTEKLSYGDVNPDILTNPTIYNRDKKRTSFERSERFNTRKLLNQIEIQNRLEELRIYTKQKEQKEVNENGTNTGI